MAETIIRQGFNGEIAVKAADNVTAYKWWVHDPANGGYPAADDKPVEDWPESALTVPKQPDTETG